MASHQDKSKPLWTPSKDDIQNSNLTKFKVFFEKKLNKNIQNDAELHRLSVEHYEEFWTACMEFLEVQHQGDLSPSKITGESHSFIGTKWFPNIRLNFAENMLSSLTNSKNLICSYDEISGEQEFSSETLRKDVLNWASTLKKNGLNSDDVVMGVVSNRYESIVLMLATTLLGGVWASCSPDFGLQAIDDRLGQVEPKFLVYHSKYGYGGKTFSIIETIQKLQEKNPCIQKTWDLHTEKPEVNSESIPLENLVVKRLFSDPLYIMFSSGTTGKPKCIIHSVGGTLLQHKKELILHTNLKPKDRLFYFTTCGWMMWNWMVSTLACSGQLYLFDGAITKPDPLILWKTLEKHQIKIFGTSPRFLSFCRNQDIIPKDLFKLNNLQTILSTGAPLDEELFYWVYKNIKSNIQLASISGGTDIISCFLLGSPHEPVYAGELQAAGLGMDVAALNDNKKDCAPDEFGELVCKKPFVSMPTGFKNDPHNKKYIASYFNHYEDIEIWRHGDYLCKTSNGGYKIKGRSDSTLNPSGVRIGTAEIYRVVESLEFVSDSIAVGLPQDGHEVIGLYIQLEENPPNDWRDIIKKTIKSQLSPRHLPSIMESVRSIPYTRSGKKMEVIVKKILMNTDNKKIETSAVSNPDSLLGFHHIKK